MDPDERITALKKAYAEILLNTAREEAARIMVSERKAQRFEHELKLAKEEALRMLIRLKHMMDAKISEAEFTSLSQQKKIEELEAQLQEAEDIVRDLRGELSEVQSELERATKEKVQHLNNHNIPTQEQILEPNRLYTCQSVELQPLESPAESILTSAMKHDSYFASIYTGTSYRRVPDLPSIISRSREPELYRNGCTHRIRACDRNHLDQELSLSGQVSKLRNEKIVREDKTGEGIHKKYNHEDENSNLEKEVVQVDSWPANWSFINKRKRAERHRKIINVSAQFFKIDQASDISFSRNHPISARGGEDSGENPSEISPRLLSDKGESSGTSENESKLVMSCTNPSTIGSSEVSISVMNLGKSSSPLMKLEPEASETSIEHPNGLLDERRFKYTFQRKRKRQSMIKLDENVSLRHNLSEEKSSLGKCVADETTASKKSTTQENDSLEKSTLEENTSLEKNTDCEQSGRGTERFY